VGESERSLFVVMHGTENDCRFLNDCKAETKVRDGCLIVGILSSISASSAQVLQVARFGPAIYVIRSLDFQQTWCTSSRIGLWLPSAAHLITSIEITSCAKSFKSFSLLRASSFFLLPSSFRLKYLIWKLQTTCA